MEEEEDMYGFYKRIEKQSRVKKNYLTYNVRVILVDWLIQVHMDFGFEQETLFLAVNVVDRSLPSVVVSWSELKLVAMAALVIACKYEEKRFPSAIDFQDMIPETYFTCLFDAPFTQEQINSMEKKILNKLGWKIMVPTIHSFLVELLGSFGITNRLLNNMAFYFGELAMNDYATTTLHSPSMIAASAIHAARSCIPERSHGREWAKTLQKTGYSKREIASCAKMLLRLAKMTAHGMPNRKVFGKYSDSTWDAVALIP
ncbi:G2/mitotic-specific cyclin S13-7-like [Corylus avellana]|uniref:G2/mitotic-specific cyclin S13-7-like n=1 Tax=Corylus avellana TaxID=13451 RepID=UPI00286CF33C|nr:G2/mitotic-specific cyclin S13-7-like [Corylus avellana]